MLKRQPTQRIVTEYLGGTFLPRHISIVSFACVLIHEICLGWKSTVASNPCSYKRMTPRNYINQPWEPPCTINRLTRVTLNEVNHTGDLHICSTARCVVLFYSVCFTLSVLSFSLSSVPPRSESFICPLLPSESSLSAR